MAEYAGSVALLLTACECSMQHAPILYMLLWGSCPRWPTYCQDFFVERGDCDVAGLTGISGNGTALDPACLLSACVVDLYHALCHSLQWRHLPVVRGADYYKLAGCVL